MSIVYVHAGHIHSWPSCIEVDSLKPDTEKAIRLYTKMFKTPTIWFITYGFYNIKHTKKLLASRGR